MYFLKDKLDREKLMNCLDSYIYNDSKMRERNSKDIAKRVEMAFKDRLYLNRLRRTDKKWLDEDLDTILNGLISFIESI